MKTNQRIPTHLQFLHNGELNLITNWDLKNSHLKVFEKGMKIHMMSHVKVCCSPIHHNSLSECGELLMELYALNLTLSFQ